MSDMLTASVRCLVTKNPRGTDTWKVGRPCQCGNCQAWLAYQAKRAGEPVGYVSCGTERMSKQTVGSTDLQICRLPTGHDGPCIVF